MKWTWIFFMLISTFSYGQLKGLKEDKQLSKALARIVKECNMDSSYEVQEAVPAQVSVAVIRMNKKGGAFAGVNPDQFIYPASVYKMYVAMEVLKQVSEGRYPLDRMYIVSTPNDVDRSREIDTDPRPLLHDGDTVTVNYLLDLMITRSDNSAANCLIDIAGRKNVNATILEQGWRGSEVTRKFLSRKLEDPGYDTVRSTVTTPRHAAEFMYRVQKGQLVNPWVSMQMKALLARQLDGGKLAAGLPAGTMFSHKTGWWQYYTHDVGIVEDANHSYVVAVFTPIREEALKGRMRELARKIHSLMINTKHK